MRCWRESVTKSCADMRHARRYVMICLRAAGGRVAKGTWCPLTVSRGRACVAYKRARHARQSHPGGRRTPCLWRQHMSARATESETLLTPSEVATLFRVDPKTVTRWAKAGKLSSIRTLGGHRRYREAEVRGLLNGIPSQREA